MSKRGVFRELFITVFIIVLSAYFVFAGTSVPTGPSDLNLTESTRRANYSEPYMINVEAGNVTGLTIYSETQTKAWAGFFGNVSGKIVLDDANNQTFYDWSVPNPTGEVYASNTSLVDWNNIYCLNVSNPDGSNANGDVGLNWTEIEADFGINESDLDGLNETFAYGYADATGFRVGAITINVEDGCSLAHPYTNEAFTTDWQEVILTANNDSIIFTAILRENADGYQSGSNDAFDFQMLVLENGHEGSELTATPYYFYVELS